MRTVYYADSDTNMESPFDNIDDCILYEMLDNKVLNEINAYNGFGNKIDTKHCSFNLDFSYIEYFNTEQVEKLNQLFDYYGYETIPLDILAEGKTSGYLYLDEDTERWQSLDTLARKLNKIYHIFGKEIIIKECT